jgi:FKBP-type peptidyl-prolyl cis-trans isomerase SlyD
MAITKDQVVALRFTLSEVGGEVLDGSVEHPIEYLHGGYEDMLEAVEAALEGKEIGATIDLTLQPADAYGVRDEDLVRVEDREDFPADVEVGAMFEAEMEDGEEMVFTVTALTETHVTVDANHPYAGKTVRFEAEVVGLRAATDEELAHGHAHSHDEDCEH